MLAFALAAGGLGIGACKSETAIVVTVDTGQITVPDMMDRIQIVVRSGAGTVEKNLLSGDLTGQSPPYTVTVLRTDESVESVLVKARGLKGAKDIGDSDEVEIFFKDGKIVKHTIVLNAVSGCEDKDGDGFFVGLGCSPELLTDCDDSDKFVYPGAPERCNGRDDNCDELQLVDEDADPTTSGCPPRLGVCRDVPIVCTRGVWDCGNPPMYSESERCDDTVDNNCNGTVNEGCPCGPADEGQPCGSDEGECRMGLTECVSGMLECAGEIGPTAEQCDDLDNDCNGQTDEIFDIGDFCVSGLGNCQAEGTFQCVDGAQECVPLNPVVPEPEPELCNDPGFQDEDCDGLSNNADSADCLIQFIWSDVCKWFMEMDANGGDVVPDPCANTLEVGLHAQAYTTLPPTILRNWVMVTETFHNNWIGSSQIRLENTLNARLRLTLIGNTSTSTDPTDDLIYTAVVRLRLLNDLDVFARYDLNVEVRSCTYPHCPGGSGFQCEDPGPNGVVVVNCPSGIN